MTAPLTREQAQELLDESTPGPWHQDGPWWYEDGECAVVISGPERQGVIAPAQELMLSDYDAALIASAPSLASSLVALWDENARKDEALQGLIDAATRFGRAHGSVCDCVVQLRKAVAAAAATLSKTERGEDG